MCARSKLVRGIAIGLGLVAAGVCAMAIRKQSACISAQRAQYRSADLSVKWCKHFLSWGQHDLTVPGWYGSDIRFHLGEAAAFADGAKILLAPTSARGQLTGQAEPWLGLAALAPARMGRAALLLFWLDGKTNDVRGFFIKRPGGQTRFFKPPLFEKRSQQSPSAGFVHFPAVPVEIVLAEATTRGAGGRSEKASYKRPAASVALSKGDILSRLSVGLLLRNGEESNSVTMLVSGTVLARYAGERPTPGSLVPPNEERTDLHVHGSHRAGGGLSTAVGAFSSSPATCFAAEIKPRKRKPAWGLLNLPGQMRLQKCGWR